MNFLAWGRWKNFKAITHRFLNYTKIVLFGESRTTLRSGTDIWERALFLPEKNLYRNTVKIKFLTDLVFQIAFVRFPDILGKIREKDKTG